MRFPYRPRATTVLAPHRRPAKRPKAVRVVAWMGCAVLANGLLAVVRPHPAWGQAVSSATVTEVLDSNQVYIQNQRAQVNSVAQRQQRVSTQSARAALRFNNGAVARLAHNSNLVVGQCAQLTQGSLLVNGSLNGCSTTTVAGVRGTIYTLEITEEGDTLIQVFEGEVVVGRQMAPPAAGEEELTPIPAEADSELDPDPTDTPPDSLEAMGWPPEESGPGGTEEGTDMNQVSPESETVEFTQDDSLVIAEGQQVTVDAENDEAIIANLTAEDFIDLLAGPLISGFVTEIPGLSDLQGVFQRLFPNIPLPFGLPSIPIPIPSIRFPF